MPSSLKGLDLLTIWALLRSCAQAWEPTVFSLNPFSGTVTLETFTRNKSVFALINQVWPAADGSVINEFLTNRL